MFIARRELFLIIWSELWLNYSLKCQYYASDFGLFFSSAAFVVFFFSFHLDWGQCDKVDV